MNPTHPESPHARGHPQHVRGCSSVPCMVALAGLSPHVSRRDPGGDSGCQQGAVFPGAWASWRTGGRLEEDP